MPYPPTYNPSKHDALHLPISRHTKRRHAHSAVRARGPSVGGIVSPNDLACWPEEIRTRLSVKWSRRLIDVTYLPLFVLWSVYTARWEDGGRFGFSIRAFPGSRCVPGSFGRAVTELVSFLVPGRECSVFGVVFEVSRVMFIPSAIYVLWIRHELYNFGGGESLQKSYNLLNKQLAKPTYNAMCSMHIFPSLLLVCYFFKPKQPNRRTTRPNASRPSPAVSAR